MTIHCDEYDYVAVTVLAMRVDEVFARLSAVAGRYRREGESPSAASHTWQQVPALQAGQTVTVSLSPAGVTQPSGRTLHDQSPDIDFAEMDRRVPPELEWDAVLREAVLHREGYAFQFASTNRASHCGRTAPDDLTVACRWQWNEFREDEAIVSMLSMSSDRAQAQGIRLFREPVPMGASASLRLDVV